MPQAVIDRAMERDEAAARAEYLAEFRTDIESFVPIEAVRACIEAGVRERPPDRAYGYVAFVDPSGGSSDSMTLAIAHRVSNDETSTIVLDCLREAKPPFSPEAVVEEFADLCAHYRITKVYGDRYAGEWPREQFRKHGPNYEPSPKSKGALYLDVLPLVNSRAVDLLDNNKLVRQFVGLERRTARGGRESIDHPPGAHDDLSNAAAGALVIASQKKAFSFARRSPQVHIGYGSAKRRSAAYQYRKGTDVSIKHEIEEMGNAEMQTERILVGETGVWIQPHEVRGERTKFGIFDRGTLCGYVWGEAAAKAAAAQLAEKGQITR